jgi:hypothetical protein
MTFYILANQITTLFLSLNLLTTLSFDSEIINYFYGGSKEELFMEVANNSKTLAIKGKREGILTNLLVITKSRKYYFNLKIDESNPHQFVEVKDGRVSHALRKIEETPEYELMEGESSILYVNRSPQDVVVNGIRFKGKEYFSKGVPLIKDGKRILN